MSNGCKEYGKIKFSAVNIGLKIIKIKKVKIIDKNKREKYLYKNLPTFFP